MVNTSGTMPSDSALRIDDLKTSLNTRIGDLATQITTRIADVKASLAKLDTRVSELDAARICRDGRERAPRIDDA
jgi:hypothetical protein